MLALDLLGVSMYIGTLGMFCLDDLICCLVFGRTLVVVELTSYSVTLHTFWQRWHCRFDLHTDTLCQMPMIYFLLLCYGNGFMII